MWRRADVGPAWEVGGKVEGRGKRYSWCHAVKEGLGCLIERLRTGKTKEHVHF